MISIRRWMVLLLAGLGCLPSGSAGAVEPVGDFLQALRARKYFDEAAQYLDQLASDTNLDAATRDRLPYEQAVSLIALAAERDDPDSQSKLWNQADELLKAFLEKHADHAQAGAARAQRAGLTIERGRSEVRHAAPGDRTAALTQARKHFEQAQSQFTEIEKNLDAQLAALPKLITPDDTAGQQRKQQLAGDLAEARLVRASIDYELAKTHEPGSAPARKHLQAAAKSYAGMYETYRTRSAGLLARLWEGRCYQELGDATRALGCYQELMELPDTAETRSLRTRGTRQAMECWTSEAVKKYQAAVDRGEQWEKESAGHPNDVDALAIRYLTALAYQKQSQLLSAKDPNRKKLVSFARQHVGPVAQQPGEYQRPARLLLVALADPKETKAGKRKPAKGEPAEQEFMPLFEKARGALERMQNAAGEIATARAAGKKDEVQKLEQMKSEHAAEAARLLNLALEASNSKTPVEDASTARYYQCFLKWDQGQYYEAAVLGEYLLQRYPETDAARQGAKIALAAWVRLYGEAKPEDRAFEIAQIERLAELSFKRWPDKPEAEDAALTLVNFAAAGGNVDKAMEYLNKVPATSPRRGHAEVRAGQALWATYLRGLRADEAERPTPEKLEALKKQAQELLTQGIGRVEKSGQVDETLVTAAFSLAQICVETSQPEKAIEWLNKPKFGPLTLLKANHPAVAKESFGTEAYKTALRAYIAVNPQQLKKAEEAMDALEKLVQKSGDAKAADNLTAIYIGLGKQLQQHLKDLQASGNTKELDNVAKSFEVFLDRVVARQGSGNFASLNWVGETYFSLGSGLDEGGQLSTPQSAAYYEKATTAYQQLLALAEKDPKYKEQPDGLLAIRLRLADCYRRAGKFDEATQLVAEVLTTKPMLLSAQILGAEIYQSRGATEADAYVKAITGGSADKTGKNLVWGWAKLSAMTMSKPEFEAIFHQARLNMAESRYRYAMMQKEPERKNKVLEAASQDLWSTYKHRPEMGGAETAARYDKTLKKIQKALGKKEIGLAEFKERDAASAAAAKS